MSNPLYYILMSAFILSSSVTILWIAEEAIAYQDLVQQEERN